jgi:hypothetical protein
MIRISAFVWILILGLLGVGLFQVKYNVQSKEAELRNINKQIAANHAAIHVLEAEWSYLNDPNRLADLARRHTDLTPTQATQIKQFSDLPPRPASAQPDLPALSSAAPTTAVPSPTTSSGSTVPQTASGIVPVSATPGSIPTAMPAVASTVGAPSNAGIAKAVPTPASAKATTQASAASKAASKPASAQAAKPGADEVIDAILADMQRQQTTATTPAAGDQ